MAAIPLAPDGGFAGYASVFGRLDDGGDMVMPGAFRASLEKRGVAGVRMLFQHDPKEPVGTWDVIAEDGFGLWVEGRLTPGVGRSEALKRLIAAKAIDGLSIGFRTIRASKQAGTGLRRLHQVELWEISIVTFPMMDGARIRRGPGPADAVASAIRALRNQQG